MYDIVKAIVVLAAVIMTAMPAGADRRVVLAADKVSTRVPEVIDQLPRSLYVENDEKSSHVQGVAVDLKREYIYFSFTTKLIKTDLKGNVVGSVNGLSCHLGCIDLDPATGKLYASIEYKDDAIGQGISGSGAKGRENTFYIGIFDTDKITSRNINAETGGVMKTVYMKQVVECYEDTVVNQGKRVAHRYGCSGIDGVSIGPQFGAANGSEQLLNVAFGIYGDRSRTDNDYQVILQYRLADLDRYAQPLDQKKPHHSGPATELNRYFVLTGNTSYGVQNLEYDAESRLWLMCVYNGAKPQYPNYSIFAIDGTKAAKEEELHGFDTPERGLVLSLAEQGDHDTSSGIWGWRKSYGSTGIESLGEGYFYIATSGSNDGFQNCTLRLYRWTGNAYDPFEAVK